MIFAGHESTQALWCL